MQGFIKKIWYNKMAILGLCG